MVSWRHRAWLGAIGGVNFIPALPNVAGAAIYLNFPFIGPFVCNVNLPPTSSCEMPCSSSRFFFPPFHPLITSKQFTARKISAPALWFCVVPEGVGDSRKWMTSFSHLHIHTHTEPISHPATVSRGCCSSPQNYQRLIKSTSGTFCQVWPRPVKRSSSLTDFCYFFPTSLMNVAVSYWVILTVLYACVAPVWRC